MWWESPPIVINLNDDNADGHINEDDVPDVLFPAFKGTRYKRTGHLLALSGADQSPTLCGQLHLALSILGTSGVAAADIDRDGRYLCTHRVWGDAFGQ